MTMIDCLSCNGTGGLNGSLKDEDPFCNVCEGSGSVEVHLPDEELYEQIESQIHKLHRVETQEIVEIVKKYFTNHLNIMIPSIKRDDDKGNAHYVNVA